MFLESLDLRVLIRECGVEDLYVQAWSSKEKMPVDLFSKRLRIWRLFGEGRGTHRMFSFW